MKLSDVKGERTLDVVAELIGPVANIAADESLAALLKREECPEGTEPREFMAGRIKSCLPGLVRGHKDDIVAILAAVDGVSPEEYAEGMTLAGLAKDVMGLLADDEMMAFLASFGQE